MYRLWSDGAFSFYLPLWERLVFREGGGGGLKARIYFYSRSPKNPKERVAVFTKMTEALLKKRGVRKDVIT
jgi:hypothetical protein